MGKGSLFAHDATMTWPELQVPGYLNASTHPAMHNLILLRYTGAKSV